MTAAVAVPDASMRTVSTHAPRICGAKTRSGTPCKGRPVTGGNGRCRMHNGSAVAGIAHPSYRTGRYSKVVKGRMAEHYEEYINDPAVTDLRDHISLTMALIAEQLERITTGEGGGERDVIKAWAALNIAFAGKNATRINEAREAVDQAVKGLGDDTTARDELHRLIEQHRKLVDTKSKQDERAGQVMTLEQAVAANRAMQLAVMDEVTDPALLRRIGMAFQRNMNLPERH